MPERQSVASLKYFKPLKVLEIYHRPHCSQACRTSSLTFSVHYRQHLLLARNAPLPPHLGTLEVGGRGALRRCDVALAGALQGVAESVAFCVEALREFVAQSAEQR